MLTILPRLLRQSVFAEILFLDENDATIALDKVASAPTLASPALLPLGPCAPFLKAHETLMFAVTRKALWFCVEPESLWLWEQQVQALEIRGFKAELAEYDDVRDPPAWLGVPPTCHVDKQVQQAVCG